MFQFQIDDSKHILLSVTEDLDALRSVAELIDGHPEWSLEKQGLKVVEKSISSIIIDIKEAVNIIDAASIYGGARNV